MLSFLAFSLEEFLLFYPPNEIGMELELLAFAGL
jgi:hypothetical protein